MPTWLKRIMLGPESDDGFGQSLANDIQFWWRFRACRQCSVAWRLPLDIERAAINSHPIIGRFGDGTIGVADVDGRQWIVRDRDWFGWPDPPEFVFFALAGNTIWVAVDFHIWPAKWTRP